MKMFILEHNLISYSVSWVVAVTFTLFIQSAVGDILLPSLYYAFLAIKTGLGYSTPTSSVDSIFEKVNKINVANFLKETITLFLILLVLYILIRDILNNWIREPAQRDGGSSSSSGLIQTKNLLPTAEPTVTSTEAVKPTITTITQQPYYFKS